jgi:hypothetical protein
MPHPRSWRIAIALLVLSSWAVALAQCQPPDASGDWLFAGEIVQNQRTVSSRTYDVSSTRTVASVANLGSTPQSATLTAGYDTNVSVSASILRWGLGSSSRTTWTHAFEVTVPAQSRVRLLHRRREEVREMRWDVMCAWRHRLTGRSALTTYGRNYSGTIWQLYDAYELRTEAL